MTIRMITQSQQQKMLTLFSSAATTISNRLAFMALVLGCACGVRITAGNKNFGKF